MTEICNELEPDWGGSAVFFSRTYDMLTATQPECRCRRPLGHDGWHEGQTAPKMLCGLVYSEKRRWKLATS